MFGFITGFSIIIVTCEVAPIIDSKSAQAQSHQSDFFSYQSQVLSHQSRLFKEKRNLKLKEMDMPVFLVLTNENSKGLRHVYESIVSWIWNSWVSLCLYKIRRWQANLPD